MKLYTNPETWNVDVHCTLGELDDIVKILTKYKLNFQVQYQIDGCLIVTPFAYKSPLLDILSKENYLNIG